MGCQSSKAASRPVSKLPPTGTLLAADNAIVKSPKATVGPEVVAEASPELQPVAATAADVPEAAAEAFIQLEPVEATVSTADQPQPAEAEDVEVPESIADVAKPDGDQNVAGLAHHGAEQVYHVAPQAVDSAAADVQVPLATENGTLQCGPQPTSRVHKHPQGWEEEGILFPHEGIRFLIKELSNAVNSMDPLPAWKWENLSTWYQDYFYTVVHHHHDAEEKIYLPWIQTRVSVPPKITTDHPDLMSAMDDLSDMLKKGASAPVAERASHLNDVKLFLSAFVEDMHEHLAEEEEIIPKLLREGGFTQEDEAPVVGQIIEGLGLDGNKKALPPMLHAYARWAGTDKAEAFVSSNLPLPIQFLYRNFWEHDFKHRHMGLLASLAEGVDTNPFASKWFC